MPKPPRCLFCREKFTGSRSREHVFPQWLLGELGIADELVEPTHFRFTGEAVSIRHHRLADLKEGRICSRCNSGWMSSLESKCKPILQGLFSGRLDLRKLPLPALALLARWSAKTAYVLNSSSNFNFPVPPSHLADLHEARDVLPVGVVAVAAQHTPSKQFSWIQSSSWHITYLKEIDESDLAQLTRGTYKIALQFGSLLLLVAFFKQSGWNYCLQKGLHHPLWPQNGPCSIRESAGPLPHNDSLAALVAFHGSLSVLERGE